MGYEKELALAKRLAKKAGRIMKDNFELTMQPEWKEDNTPLTIADTAINDLVVKSVREAFPEDGVLGEEDSYETGRPRVWVVDPIDGTMPFSHGMPTASFSLALVINGAPVVAAIQDPFSDRTYTAVQGQGAYVNGQPIHVNQQERLGPKVFVAVDARTDFRGHNIVKIIDALAKTEVRLTKNYSAVFNALPVAAGKYAASIVLIEYPWDGAAICLLVIEAGGRATDLSGRERRWDEQGEGFIVSNGVLHERLVEMVAKAKGA